MQIVAYYRVSTKSQGASGLGLEAQRAAVLAYAAHNDGVIVREFTEVESGRKDDSRRPQLAQALPFSKRTGARLVVAKLDRLARNLAFLSKLMQAGVDFIACDMPTANKLTIHILAAVAEAEADMISQRTRDALAAAKARGVKLGSSRPGHWDGREDARRAAALRGSSTAAGNRAEASRIAYADLLPTIQTLREQGLSLGAIARTLNESGQRTRRNCLFTAVQVATILKRGAG